MPLRRPSVARPRQTPRISVERKRQTHRTPPSRRSVVTRHRFSRPAPFQIPLATTEPSPSARTRERRQLRGRQPDWPAPIHPLDHLLAQHRGIGHCSVALTAPAEPVTVTTTEYDDYYYYYYHYYHYYYAVLLLVGIPPLPSGGPSQVDLTSLREFLLCS